MNTQNIDFNVEIAFIISSIVNFVEIEPALSRYAPIFLTVVSILARLSGSKKGTKTLGS